MASLMGKLKDVQAAIDALARRHRVPGAVLAIGQGDELVDFATGVLNVNTGVETTTDSLFQIGSNTKLYTTTLVMQLVDAGQVDLDQPVRTYLPTFSLDDPTAADEITVRQLLTHTSGIQGDHFQGFGRGEEAIARYVDSLAEIDLVHRPGELWSYCNSGFVVAGRLAEVLTNTPYHELLQTRICQPLGLSQTTVLLEDMVAHRLAVGHMPGPGGRPVVPPRVTMDYAQAPSGSMTVSTAAELVRFVQSHLDDGRALDGSQMLSETSVRAMQELQVERPPTSTAPLTQGLGWMMSEWDRKRVLAHGGLTIGQASFLQALPDEQLVVTLLTNSGGSGLLWRDLGQWLFDELAGVDMPRPLRAATSPPELALERYEGTYERLGVRHRVAVEDGGLILRTELDETTPIGQLNQRTGAPPPPPLRLRPVDAQRFVARQQGAEEAVAFLGFVRGRPRYLFAARVARRTRARNARNP